MAYFSLVLSGSYVEQCSQRQVRECDPENPRSAEQPHQLDERPLESVRCATALHQACADEAITSGGRSALNRLSRSSPAVAHRSSRLTAKHLIRIPCKAARAPKGCA